MAELIPWEPPTDELPVQPRPVAGNSGRTSARGRRALGGTCIHQKQSGLDRCDRWDHLPGNGRGPVAMGRITVSLSWITGLVKPVFLLVVLVLGLMFAKAVLPGLVHFQGLEP